MKSRTWNWLAGFAWVAFTGAHVDAAAAPADGRAAGCEPLRTAARQERLSQLLRELSQVRSFHLENWSSEDPWVTHAGGSDLELMTALSGQANLIVRYAAAKECPGQRKIDTIWVLPRGPEPVIPKVVLPAPTAAEEAATKAAVDRYVRAHTFVGAANRPARAASDGASAPPSAAR